MKDEFELHAFFGAITFPSKKNRHIIKRERAKLATKNAQIPIHHFKNVRDIATNRAKVD